MARTEIRRLADKLDNAFQCFARDNGDGFYDRDFQGAYEYREEGYALAEKAFPLSGDLRDGFVEVSVEAFEERARYLVSCAVAFRLAELEAEAPAQRVAA